jgi:hypothetical protein
MCKPAFICAENEIFCTTRLSMSKSNSCHLAYALAPVFLIIVALSHNPN